MDWIGWGRPLISGGGVTPPSPCATYPGAATFPGSGIFPGTSCAGLYPSTTTYPGAATFPGS